MDRPRPSLEVAAMPGPISRVGAAATAVADLKVTEWEAVGSKVATAVLLQQQGFEVLRPEEGG